MPLQKKPRDLSNQAVSEFTGKLRATFDNAKKVYLEVSSQQIEEARKKYSEPTYKMGYIVLINSKVLFDPFYRQLISEKLRAKKIGTFPISSLVGRNAVSLDLPNAIRAHSVINVSHNYPYLAKPFETSEPIPDPPEPIFGSEGPEKLFNKVMAHRTRGRGWQFLVSWKNEPDHEASWEPLRNFLDEGGVVTKALIQYTRQTPELHDDPRLEMRFK